AAPRVVFTSGENSPPPEPVARPFSTTLRSGGAPPPATVPPPPPPPVSPRLQTTPAKLQPRAQLAAPPLPIPAPKLTPPIAQPALRPVPVPGPTQPQRVAVPIAPLWPPVEPQRLPTIEAELPPVRLPTMEAELPPVRLPTMEADLPPAASLPSLHLPHEQPEVPTVPVPHQPRAPQWPLEPAPRPTPAPAFVPVPPPPARVAATLPGLRDAGPEQRVATLPVSGRGPRPRAAERRSMAPLLLTMALLAGAIAAAIYVARMYITGSSKQARDNALPSASTGPSTSPSTSTSPSASTSPSTSPSASASPSPSPTVAAVTPDAGPGTSAPVPGGPIVTRPIDSGPCPAGAILIPGKPQLCVDTHEAPGAGKLPTTGISFSDAARACAQRDMRLCEGEEFERACRGHHRSSYPYGSSFSASRCNAERSGHKQPVPTGSLPACVSEAGMFDMSGNVAEWVSEGKIAGGSFDDGDGRCSRRFSRDKGRGHDDVGYRCCSDPRE
ncbi:MAG: SUMF1/EgtB/PvdO family nonheme iron enzyme, partial [Deltaproteobacteria bacterium]|nr:SUMF1/EgtB/PvdO family nonheme iron enzyme [Deltaproteobacteria bacterium]